MVELGKQRSRTVAGEQGRVVPVRALRAELVPPGNVREEIGFQNDVNGMLASLEASARAWTLAALPMFSSDRRRKRRPTVGATTARLPAFTGERDDAGCVPIARLP